MPSWNQIAKENLTAAQKLAELGSFRSCVSRAYYASFSAVSFSVRAMGPFAKKRETPPHQEVPALLRRLLVGMEPWRLRNLLAMTRRLYNERLVADYQSGRTINALNAVQALQDARAICRELGVT